MWKLCLPIQTTDSPFLSALTVTCKLVKFQLTFVMLGEGDRISRRHGGMGFVTPTLFSRILGVRRFPPRFHGQFPHCAPFPAEPQRSAGQETRHRVAGRRSADGPGRADSEAPVSRTRPTCSCQRLSAWLPDARRRTRRSDWRGPQRSKRGMII